MTHHWEALGWTLVHFLWQGAAIALTYRIVDLALARRSANARYLLALGALLSMLMASAATLVHEEDADQSARPIAGSTGAGVTSAAVPTAQPFEISLVDGGVGVRQTDRFPARFTITALMPYLDGVWLAGVLLLWVRALGGWWLIRRMRLSRLEQGPHTLLLRLDALRRQMGIRRFVDLRLSSRIANPLTAGVLRPWILLPITALTSLSAEQIEVILSHELAHIRRADYFWNLLQTMVETLFFFHPAVWWVSRRVREERELCCDDIAVRRCSDPTVYAVALVRLEEERRNRLHLAMALDGHQSRAGLRARVLRILGDTEERPRRLKPVSFAGIAVALIVFLCPLPKVFASFREVPQVATAIAPVVRKAMHPMLQSAAPEPAPTAAPEPKPSPDVAANPQENAPSEPAQNSDAKESGHSDYIDEMKAAGYDVDLDKYIAMKAQGITPAYAAEMAKVSGGRLSADNLIAMKVQDVTLDYAADMAKIAGEKLSADNLIAMKIQDVTPEYIQKMRAAGYDAGPDKYIAMKIQDITPEYAEAMAKVGFGKPDVGQLIALKVQGVTPEYAAQLHSEGIEATSLGDLISYRIFNITPDFVKDMKAAGFDAIPAKKLVALRVQGVTPEFAKSARAQFPDATLDDLIQMRIFNIDANFIASAQRHGFAPLTIHKLVKLRISGILDDGDEQKENRP
jgi:beta-lactamase regulating signal transducer with metallopeptidase domain